MPDRETDPEFYKKIQSQFVEKLLIRLRVRPATIRHILSRQESILPIKLLTLVHQYFL